ncbi:hypothetical protein E4U60_007443 [Claviceps pazoutovae]|uniref:BTB domain-containing protein n=1 Tax=Claviceps pazoutovae TaxID=1649127 RepID=A0A9P7MFJ9_9HYPO|nr:hypothetical protein E4U60_007443 [Claviceps pazoutovae]
MGTTGGGKQEVISYASFMSSKAFEFLVGPEKKPFIIHSELVASLSPVLQRLVKGELKEAQKGSVVWEHVDEQTFIRFSHVFTEFREWDDVADILVKLLRYCFENDTPAELREFVVRYAVCHIENLWERTEITELARTHADFSSAIVEAMLYSLSW